MAGYVTKSGFEVGWGGHDGIVGPIYSPVYDRWVEYTSEASAGHPDLVKIVVNVEKSWRSICDSCDLGEEEKIEKHLVAEAMPSLFEEYSEPQGYFAGVVRFTASAEKMMNLYKSQREIKA